MKVIFGVVSWFPDKEPDRSLRIERISRMLLQVREAFGNVEWLVIAQNWKDYKVPEDIHATIFNYPALGILRARKELRRRFLESDADYLIMCDDDLMLEYKPGAPQKYLEEIEKHPNGFCVIRYEFAQLNLLAISKYLYEKEPMVNVDPQKDEGFEDILFSQLLHIKYPEYEFHVDGITHVQFNNPNEKAPSTWANDKPRNWQEMIDKSDIYLDNFRKGNFDVESIKKTIDVKMRQRAWVKEALYRGWINKEDVDKYLK